MTVAGRTYRLEVVASLPARKALADRDFSSAATLVLQGHARYHHYEIPRKVDALFLDEEDRILEIVRQEESKKGGITSSVECRRALLLPPGSGARAGERVTLPSLKVAGEPESTLKLDGHVAHTEIARTWEERTQGLMWRPRMSKDDGMLFVYDSPDSRRFWMGNTLIDLDIAFFREDRSLINVVEMRKYLDPAVDTGERAASLEPAMYVLELNYGWFRSKGLIDAEGRPVRRIVFE